MAIKSSSAKDKGRRLQNWTCERVSEVLQIPWGRDEMIAPREMGQSGTDVRLVGEAAQRLPFAIECKAHESWAVPSWIKQAKDNAGQGVHWLLVAKKNRQKPVVIMDAEVFFGLLAAIERRERGMLASLLSEVPSNDNAGRD